MQKRICLFIILIFLTGCELFIEKPKINSDTNTYILSGNEEIEINTQTKNKVLFNKGDSIDDFRVYDNDEFIILYPDYWDFKENFQGADVVFIAPLTNIYDSFSENLNVIIQDFGNEKWNLDKYTAYSIHQITAFSDNGIVLESKPITLSNQEGHHLLYIYKNGSIIIKSKAVYTIENNKAYLITYTAEEKEYDNYIDDINKMIESFRII